MIQRDRVTLNGLEFYRTYSDQGYYIVRDNMLFKTAYDPILTTRLYKETDQLIKY